jgi:hypothetical protein
LTPGVAFIKARYPPNKAPQVISNTATARTIRRISLRERFIN